ncbi:MAG: ABC transporter C-terminal domain-containing protein, partial [Ruegeria sp.]|uniref:ABC transporter C-terminal domain-containing protein n=1 Tax=Ruegeria sp. TaxID=1879320 RepID=UPI00349EA070
GSHLSPDTGLPSSYLHQSLCGSGPPRHRRRHRVLHFLKHPATPEIYPREPDKFQKATEALVQRQEKLAAAEEEWLVLEEKSEAG